MFSSRQVSLSIVAVLAGFALAGCAAGPDVLAGRVADDTIDVQAPSIPMPQVSLNAGAPPAPDAAGADVSAGAQRTSSAAPGRSVTPTITAITGLGTVVRLKSVAVREGDRVSAGDVVAMLDTEALDANIAMSQATLKATRAQVGVLDDALDTVADNRSTLSSNRAKVGDAISQLTTTRAELASRLAQARKALKQVEKLLGSMPSGGVPPGATPPGSAPGTLPPGALPPGTKPPGTPPPGSLPPADIPDPAELRAGIAQLEAGIRRIDSGLAQARSAQAQLSSASGRLTDAKTLLKNLRQLARISVDAARVSVRIAKNERSLAEVRSPSGGVVVWAASAGDVLSPGATLVRIRPDGATRITTWITPQTERWLTNATGPFAKSQTTDITVSTDWTGSRGFSASVSHIGVRAEYPPTSFATDEVHLTRAIPLELRLDDDNVALPAGAPVDIRLDY